MKITKEEFDSLFSIDITKRKYDEIIDRINSQAFEIFKEILTLQNRDYKNFYWFDYDNFDPDGPDGFFDPEKYKENIFFAGDFKQFPVYGNYFPTRFLWEDFESEVLKETKEAIDQQKKENQEKIKKIQEKEEKRKKIIESIQSKLTKEELKLIKFKK